MSDDLAGDVSFGGAAGGAGPAPPVVGRAPGARRRCRAWALHRAQARQRHPPRSVVQQGKVAKLHAEPPTPISRFARGLDAVSAYGGFHSVWAQDTAFPMTERDRLGLRGLLPPRVMSFEQQYERFSESPFPFAFVARRMGCGITEFVVVHATRYDLRACLLRYSKLFPVAGAQYPRRA